MARNCRLDIRYPEASGRQTTLRTAAVSPDSEAVQQAGNGSDASGKASKWMHGVCHASQGGDPPEHSTFQPLRLGPTLKIPVIVVAQQQLYPKLYVVRFWMVDMTSH